MLLITGSHGQLGQSLTALLPDAITVSKQDLDITDEQAVSKFITDNKIEIIINCAAYTSVDDAEDNRGLATSVNVDGVRNLSKTGAKIVHISTDYVFDGAGHRPYLEDDETAPTSVYGQTKLQGEQAVFDHASTALIIRTSWLYGSLGRNFLAVIHKMAGEKDSLNVVADQVGTPTYVGDLAQVIADILPQIKEDTKEIYHYSNEGVCSWYDFAYEIIEQAHLKCIINAIETVDYPTKATRPYYSVLNKSKIKKTFDLEIPHWKESLKKCLDRF